MRFASVCISEIFTRLDSPLLQTLDGFRDGKVGSKEAPPTLSLSLSLAPNFTLTDFARSHLTFFAALQRKKDSSRARHPHYF